MENRGWAVTCTPVITVRGGSPQILDAALYSHNTCWIVDTSVVADNAHLDNAHISKCVKYDTPAVRDWCQANWPSEGVPGEVFFGALIFNWRGAISPKSASMCRTFSITRNKLVIFSTSVCEWGWKVLEGLPPNYSVAVMLVVFHHEGWPKHCYLKQICSFEKNTDCPQPGQLC